MLPSKHLSNRYSPVLTIKPGPVWPIAIWLAVGFLPAIAGLFFNSLPAIAKLMLGGFLLAGFCYEWCRWVVGASLHSIRLVRWETNRWRLQTQSGSWQSAILLADRCRFLWGVKLCWLDENNAKKSVLFFRSRQSWRSFRRFRIRLKLENIA